MKYIKKDKNGDIKFTFIESKELLNTYPITTPLTFSFIGYDLVLAKKKVEFEIFSGVK